MATAVSPVSDADSSAASCEQEEQESVSYVPSEQTPLFIGFNQDRSRFACGNAHGFKVYDCHPLSQVSCRESTDDDGNGGIAYVEMLFRSHIFALVGGGPTPRYPSNKVMIWDDHQNSCIGELSFRSQVRAVKLRRDRIVVALESKVYVYNFADLRLLLQIDTCANPKGLCAISLSSNSVVLACPSLRKGQVRIDFHDSKKPILISAHESALACLVLTMDGQYLATASSTGTLVRVFNTLDGTLLQEVRRGKGPADIYSVSFSNDAHWLALSSHRGTIHIFNLREQMKKGEKQLPNTQSPSTGTSNGSCSKDITSSGAKLNPGSSLSFMKGFLPSYFSSERSFCQFRLPEKIKSIVAFGPEQNSIVIVSLNGSFYRCTFDPVQGGQMVQQEHLVFTKLNT
ncbi:hypothetical protein KP509_1Z168800 [Ceratopteris richardii]|nr:hypothetical protein KP509_1Z168800 [Ceratopteris richardii]